MGKFIDLSGLRFGKLTVIEFSYRENKASHFRCQCDCGNISYVSSQSLRKKRTSSCGCSKGEFISKRKIRHGLSNTRIYRIWENMINRCCRSSHHNYKWYGGIGIKVCERWMSFDNFYEDTKEGYSDELTLDRYPDKEGNYEPHNYRWATKKEQARNRKTSVCIEYDNQKLTCAEWAEKLGFNQSILSRRKSWGWDAIKILTTPVKIKNHV